ncbi:hypothetical protein BKE38_20015 [Pseudoroseomonas deserti]|uniref:DUF2946 domain-containing protein n=1 Tax=Teichococcus deserti TaxID=1817963 RepID=A0A1V2GY21_9PROT|nr:hypothetical protein [Pseudoroseomonas deserti]ONG50000.1 hypothetical protein BKE38_20015 [Pseudoroseomonas deserti]
MTRRSSLLRALLLSLVGLLLLGQSVAAPAHCLRTARPASAAREAAQGWAVLGIAMPICTPDGMAMGTGDPAAPDHGEPGFCAVAQALPQAWAPEPPALPPPRWHLAEVRAVALREAPPLPAARASPFVARGPPGAA